MTSECKHRTFIVKANTTYCRKCKSRLPRYRHEQARDIITRGKLIRHEEPTPAGPPEPEKCSHIPMRWGKRIACAFCHEDLGMERQRMADEILMERTIESVLKNARGKLVDALLERRQYDYIAPVEQVVNPNCPHFWKPSGVGTWECHWCPEHRTSVYMPVS